jgi:6-phosphogluconolactonase
MSPRLEVSTGAASVAALEIGERVRACVEARGRAVVALSGGSTPVPMLAALAALDLPWDDIHVIQVDERVVPRGSEQRNLTAIADALDARVGAHLHAMEVDGDLDAARDQAVATLRSLAGDPPVIDVVHLGVGDDGHTASLAPGGGDLTELGEPSPVGVVRDLAGHDRLTLTMSALLRARSVVWLVTGSAKAAAVARLLAGDLTVPAGKLAAARASAGSDADDVLVVDADAASAVPLT